MKTQIKPRLYTYALSPYGMKVYWALIYKGIEFDLQYVSPVNQAEIKFTDQKVIPVMQIEDDWRIDSGPICKWLDEHFPERPIDGKSAAEQAKIAEVDAWVSGQIIGLWFRTAIEDDTKGSAYRNALMLGNMIHKTTPIIPWGVQFIWLYILRRVKFIQRHASQVDRSIPIQECREGILRKVEEMLDRTGFLAGTDGPTYADISLFAQLACFSNFPMEGFLHVNSSPRLTAFYNRMSGYFDRTGHPDLFPGFQPYRSLKSTFQIDPSKATSLEHHA